ncbi:YbaB/EbfC family nucleoid-associated protein [Actinomadura decatromicini]|uniref:YbaB/EbfC family nucleoid-associated protein n=1 Tax=Actinomadura decatromicini TaxID=2604572 RepID=A0A5D3F450_9ACTN|nr:YbaB/EbfC family nucleoid-associated protein [Actinomadura decatromicini]
MPGAPRRAHRPLDVEEERTTVSSERDGGARRRAADPGIGDLPDVIEALPDMIEEFVEDFGRRRGELRELREEIKKARTTVSADRRVLTVTVGPLGELVSLKFNDENYRDLAPTDLADLIVRTVEKAREKAMGKMSETLSPALPRGLDWDAVMNGRLDLADILPENPFESLDLAAFLDRRERDG